MKCKEAKQKIILASDGLLSPEESAELERHLTVCAECREESAADSRVAQDLSMLPVLEPKESGWERLQARIENERVVHRHPLWKPVLVSCSLVVIAFILISMQVTGRREEKPRIAGNRPAVVSHKPAPEVTVENGAKEPVVRKQVKRVASLNRHVRVRKPDKIVYNKPVYRKTRVVKAAPSGTIRRNYRIVRRETAPPPTAPVKYVQPVQEEEQYTAELQPAPAVSSEISEFISEGLGVMVEASEDLKGSDREKQL